MSTKVKFQEVFNKALDKDIIIEIDYFYEIDVYAFMQYILDTNPQLFEDIVYYASASNGSMQKEKVMSILKYSSKTIYLCEIDLDNFIFSLEDLLNDRS